MENKNRYDEVEVDRPQLTYEMQLNQLHEIADNLERKVAHIAYDYSGKKILDSVPDHATRLNRDIQLVINRLEAIVDSIQN